MGPGGLSMSKKHLHFIQISKKQVVQLELHPFLTASHVEKFQRNWFQNDHMEEVELLLKPVLAKYEAFDPKTLKDKDTRTQGCLVGQSIRLGFLLKPKAERQSLLTRSSATAGHKSAAIRNVKLVVYVCPRLHGNNTSINTAFSQLLREECRTDQSEISSYFQQVPHKQVADTNTTTSSTGGNNKAATTSTTTITTISKAANTSTATTTTTTITSIMRTCKSSTRMTSANMANSIKISSFSTGMKDGDGGLAGTVVPPSLSPKQAQQKPLPHSPKHNPQNPPSLRPRRTRQNSGGGVLSEQPDIDHATAGSAITTITSSGPAAATTTNRDDASVKLTECGPLQSHDRECAPEVCPVTTENGQEESQEDQKKAALKNMMQRRAQRWQLSRKKRHSQNKAVGKPPSISEGFKRQSSLSHHHHSHAAKLTSISTSTYRMKKKGKITPDDALQMEDNDLPSTFRRTCIKGSQQSPLDRGFTRVITGETADGEFTQDLDLPAIVAPKVRQGRALCKHSGKSLSPSNQSCDDRLDLHLRSPREDCSRSRSPAVGLPGGQQNGLSPAHSSVSLTQNDSDPQKKRSDLQSPAYSDSPRGIKKLRCCARRGELPSFEESEQVLNTQTKPSTTNEPSSRRFSGKRSEPLSSSSSSPASSPSSISSPSPKSAGHNSMQRHAVKTGNLSTKNCDKPRGLSQSCSSSDSSSTVSSNQIQSAKSLCPPVKHKLSICGIKSTPKTKSTHSQAVDHEDKRMEHRVEHIASPGLQTGSQIQPPQVTNAIETLEAVPRDLTIPASSVLDVSREATRDNSDHDRNRLSLQDDTRDCFVIEKSQEDALQPACSERERSPVFPCKRQSHHSSLEENGSSAAPKRRRLSEVDRTPLSSLTENSREEATQGSTSRNHRRTLSLSDEELQKRVLGLRRELTAIYNGRLHSDRHKRYVEGGNSRRLLDQDAQLQCLREGQEDVVMDVLLAMFTGSQLKNLDYLMRVMLPEALMMVHKQVTEHPSSELGNC